MNWKQLFEQYLLSPHTTEAPKEENLFCISLLFHPEEWDVNPLEPLSELRIFKTTILHNIPKPKSTNGHDLGLCLFYESGAKALKIALKIEKRFSHSVRVSLSYGIGLSLESHKTLHSFQAERLNHFTNPHEVTLTAAAKQTIELPDGIGAFEASKPQQTLVGFPFWVVKDYR
jgi:hypothetical protein